MLPPYPGTSERTNLFGKDRDGLREFLEPYRVPAYHAEQIYRWLYQRRELSVAAWTDLSLALRTHLDRDAVAEPGRIATRAEAPDRTVKYRIDLADGKSVESVYMEQASRVTLCVSSQVGCALDCDFCLTGKMGFVRHLSPGEIAGQVALICRDRDLGERPFNIVFMGMGEPLHNYDAVMASFRLLVDPHGFGLSRKRITVSTSGLAPAVEKLAGEPVRPRLAISLNATTDAVRDRVMPINRKYPIDRLLQAVRKFRERTDEHATLEYVLLEGINDTDDDAARLARIATSIDAKVNLIPFNAVPDWLTYRPPTRERVLGLRDRLLARRVRVSIRWSRGAEARAACGQLALLPESPSAS